jgi:3-oxoadipate enol-lactonase
VTHWQDRFVDLDGRRIHYLDEGEGPAVVLLHSGGGSLYEFEEVVEPLAARFRVIAWDMPGHGDSDPLLKHHAIEDHRAVLERFVDALGVDTFALVGASIGGFIGVDYGLRHPKRLDRLVLVEAPLRSPQWYIQNWAMFEAMCAIPETPFEQLAPRFRKLTPELHARWNIDRNKAGSWTIVDLAWASRDFNMGEAFASLPSPPAVILGSKGPTAVELDRMRAAQPEAVFITLEDCGHFVMLDDPARFAEALSEALAG